jgi:hypothetical protein
MDVSGLRQRFEGQIVVDGEEGEDRVRAAFGPDTYARLQALKDRDDPTNLFRLNQNIKPTDWRDEREAVAATV